MKLTRNKPIIRIKRPFVLDRIPAQCSEGPFWGNGKMGAVLYVRENALCLSLDHTALWEMRDSLPDTPRANFATILQNKQRYKRGDAEFVSPTDVFEHDFGRTKLPGLRISLLLPSAVTAFRCETDLRTATSSLALQLANGQTIAGEIHLNSQHNLLSVELTGDGAEATVLRADGWDLSLPALKALARWNYPPCTQRETDGLLEMRQGYSGDQTAVLLASGVKSPGRLSVLATLDAGVKDADGCVNAASALLSDCRNDNGALRDAHLACWESFWNNSDIEVPNERLQDAYDLEMYKLYCNERMDSAPVTLQGVWNPDNRMPAWFGDLHNDLNVQACYWPAFRTGNARLAQPYIDYYSRAVPRLNERAEKLFGVKNAIHIPVMMAPDGSGAASEWCYWNTLLGPELFVATDFCWFYEYTQDATALAEQILPFLCGVARLYQAIAVEGDDGLLHIPFTQSPEFDDENGMVMADDATFVLAALHYILDKICRYSALLHTDCAEWHLLRERLARPAPLPNGYPVFPDMALSHSHRHFCHLYPIFPLGVDGHSKTANDSLDHAINQGFTQFAAFSFPYLAIFAARCGRGNMCRTMLEIYCMVFRSRNSFTVNGDPYRNGVLRISDTNAGESDDAFTLESGLMLPAALAEMLAHRTSDCLWLLAGIPDDWRDCAGSGLAVEGGHRITVAWQNYRPHSAEIVAGCTETLTLVLPASDARPVVSGCDAASCPVPETGSGTAFRLALNKGETVSISFVD